MTASQSLFPKSLIPAEISASLPDGYTIRPLEKLDYTKGYFDCLRVLTWCGNITQAEFDERYDEMDTGGKGPYYLLVIEHENRIVGMGSLIVEKKFIHNRGQVGHIEEICIADKLQGKGFGKLMIKALDAIAVNVGCYKNILNCSPRNEPFYSKCDYSNCGIEMAHYFEEETESYRRG